MWPAQWGTAIPMDAFEVNKTAGAVLSALLVVFASKTMLDIVYKEHKPEKPGWALPITEPQTAAKAPAAPFDAAKVLALLPKASAENGQDTFKNCLHLPHPREGRPATAPGPICGASSGASRARTPGFPYSDAMKNHPGDWTWEELAKYLHDPRADMPGNKMAFAGIKDEPSLADLLAYLRKLSDAPPPLPQ